MGWSGYTLRISVRVDAHGGEKERHGEQLYQELIEALTRLCEDPKYAEINVMF